MRARAMRAPVPAALAGTSARVATVPACTASDELRTVRVAGGEEGHVGAGGRLAPPTDTCLALSQPTLPPRNTLQTPATARYTGRPAWTADLDALLAAPGRPPPRAARAASLAAAVRAAHASADAWWAFLAHEEAGALDAGASPLPPPDPPGGPVAAAALLRLYEAAARAAAPRGGSGSSSYVRLWLGLARRTWGRRGADEGRDVFKTVRASTRGGACAHVWSEWAGLEAAADGGGGAAKAAALLTKGRAAGAGPTDVLEAATAAVATRVWPPAGVPAWHATDTAPAAGPRRPPARPPAATPSGRVTTVVSAAGDASEAPTPTARVGGGGALSSTVKPPRRIGGGAATPAMARPPPPPQSTSSSAAKRKAAADAGALSPAAAAPADAPKRRSPPDNDDAAATTLAAPPLGRGRPTAVPTVMKGGASARALMGADGDATTRPLSGRRQEVAGATDQPSAPAPPPPPPQRRPREDDASILVRGTRYAKLECVGRGGSSKVYKVMAPSRKIYALKRIRLTGRDAEAAQGFVDEIGLLTALKGRPGIVELIDAEVVPSEKLILVVLEYGDIDLARLLAKQQAGAAAAARRAGGAAAAAPPPPDGVFIRLYWRQMLDAVATIHAARIVHSDLKPANFLVVQGCLKLIDFGIAKAIGADTTSIARESQVGWWCV